LEEKPVNSELMGDLVLPLNDWAQRAWLVCGLQHHARANHRNKLRGFDA
jgi:hypothetical protein